MHVAHDCGPVSLNLNPSANDQHFLEIRAILLIVSVMYMYIQCTCSVLYICQISVTSDIHNLMIMVAALHVCYTVLYHTQFLI